MSHAKKCPKNINQKWKFYIEKTFLRLLKNCLHKFHDFITIFASLRRA